MGNFNGGNRGGGFGGGDRRGGFRGSNGRDREITMHKAVCDECKNNCEVPFRPSGDKPIYCSDCFSSKRETEDRGSNRDFRDRGPRKEFSPRPMQNSFAKPQAMGPGQDDTKRKLSEINMKLDRVVLALEKLVLSKGGTVEKPRETSHIVKPTLIITPKVEAKKVQSLNTIVKKAMETKKAPAKKVIVKKVETKKAPAKKVVAKKKK